MSIDKAVAQAQSWTDRVAAQRRWPDAVLVHVDTLIQQAQPGPMESEWFDALKSGSPLLAIDAWYVSDEEQAEQDQKFWLRLAELMLQKPPPGEKPPEGYTELYTTFVLASNTSRAKAEQAWLNSPLGLLYNTTTASAQDLRDLPDQVKPSKGTIFVVVAVVGVIAIGLKLIRGGI